MQNILTQLRGITLDQPDEELWSVLLKALVRKYDLALAWMGICEGDMLIPQISIGTVENHLENFKLDLNAPELPDICIIMNRAISMRKPFGCGPTTNGHVLKDCCERSLSQGILSNLALPVIIDDTVHFCVVLSSHEEETFHDDAVNEIALLVNDTASLLSLRKQQVLVESKIAQAERTAWKQVQTELHDTVCQQLTAAHLMGQVLKKKYETTNSVIAGEMSDMNSTLETAMRQIREIVSGISPINPGPNALRSALMNLAMKTEQVKSVTCALTFDEETEPRDINVACEMYYIASEAINNACRHGSPTIISISLKKAHEGIMLGISDDGTGFQETSTKPCGVGLTVMRRRAHSIGAELVIESEKGRGTSISCLTPLDDKPLMHYRHINP